MNANNESKIDIDAGIALLEQQIEAAQHLLEFRPLNKELHAAWNEETRSCLTKSLILQ